ncbi:hypothetical protein [Actinokineospora enzanensis]|uniref:hypothetical protein n=1 Tax=Actinokineospora enzanensis TaxID=155975 RepID=UPI001B7FD518|nr:hypothetical protein [Actinokineospora enzanensis]
MGKTNRFGLGRVTELDRELAAGEIAHARSHGEYDRTEAARRLARVRVAGSHAELRVAVVGRVDLIPPVLEAAPAYVGGLCLVAGLVNFLIWLSIGLIGGQWDPEWLVWVLMSCALLGAGVWGARHRDRRMRSRGTP